MALSTRLTQRLGIAHPILSAPMAMAAGGRLAATVTHAGGLGFIGGGYGDRDWLEAQFAAAGNAKVGCGFITWSLRKRPELLQFVLDRKPAAVFFSFDDPLEFGARVKAAGALLVIQVQTLKDAGRAVEAGADVIIAQGAEAGGHGERRATLTLVPEIADMLARTAPETLLCAAGGIADGRGLAAALMLGADGVLVGSRLWASDEALVHPDLHAAALAANGDDTVRSSVPDIARRLDWPGRYSIRVVRNEFLDRWHGNEEGLRAAIDSEAAVYARAYVEGNARIAAPIAGEAIGLIDRIEPARVIIERIVSEAEALLSGAGRFVVRG